MKKNILLPIVITTLMATSLASCTTGNKTSSPNASTAASTATQPTNAPAAEASKAGGPGSIKYPIENASTETIKYWKEVSGDLIRKPGISNDNQSDFAKELMRVTGTKIDFINPATGQAVEQFKLLLASGDMPDIVERPWLKEYNAGPDDAINKKLVYDMTDTIAQWAPDFLDYIKNHGELDKKFKTDSGRYWGMGFIRENDYLCVWRGPIVRTDLLKKYNLEVPTTIDEWTNMLKTFKNNGVEIPLSATASNGIDDFLGEGPFSAWGAMPGIYLENGKTVYGPMQDGFKQTLLLLRGWYADGLLDKNFATNTAQELNAIMGSGRAGATIGNTGGGIGAWTPVLQKSIPDATLEAAPYPTVNKGERAKFGQKEQDFYQEYVLATISPKSKAIETSMKLLNYGYTAEGNLFMNYGVEGKSYDMVDGKPIMKPEIAKAPDNKAEWSNWARAPYNGIMVQRQGYLEQLLVLDVQKQAIQIWSANDREKYILPPVTQSVEEGKEFSKIYSAIFDYYKEFTVKYIMGELPEDAFEKEFVTKVKSMGIDKALELRQTAYERYMSR